MIYNNFRRPVLRFENPKISLPQISKFIGEEWAKLSEKQKEIWHEKAKSLKLDYEIEKF